MNRLWETPTNTFFKNNFKREENKKIVGKKIVIQGRPITYVSGRTQNENLLYSHLYGMPGFIKTTKEEDKDRMVFDGKKYAAHLEYNFNEFQRNLNESL